jgi:hypothetical protein
MDPVSSDLAQESDMDAILAINRLEYGPEDILATPADYAWRCEQNPVGKAAIPVIRNASGDVVGFIWVIPMRLRVKGQDCLAATGTNLVIHPAYRHNLGYVKLLRRFEQVFKDRAIPLHFSFVSKEAYRRQRERQPQAVMTIPLLLKPLDLESLARSYWTGKWQRFSASWGGRLVAPLVFRPRQATRSQELSVSLLDCFPPYMDEFWRQTRDKYPVMAVRDLKFLQWRFAPVSNRRYHVLVVHAQGHMAGYAVLRCATVRGVETGLVMDLLLGDGPWCEQAGDCLTTEIEAFFRARGMSLVTGLMMPFSTEYRTLRRAGYRLVPPALAPRLFHFAVFSHTDGQSDLTQIAARDWFITLADYESL